jgi:DNA-binding transcriptional regulator YiaG
MNILEYEKLLNKANLNKRDFSEISKVPYQTLMNWNRNKQVPNWVKPFLENYIKAKSYEDIKNKVFEIEKI